MLTDSDQLDATKQTAGAVMRRIKFMTGRTPSMQDCNFLDVPLSQSDHKQLRELPNLQRIVALNRGGELK